MDLQVWVELQRHRNDPCIKRPGQVSCGTAMPEPRGLPLKPYPLRSGWICAAAGIARVILRSGSEEIKAEAHRWEQDHRGRAEAHV